ncbi:MAG TPA: pyridoxal-dependent decarboxylase, partial [Gaiellaceae bacterium]|nr:pyridoxal-dependent decarboxylase [Gaiellaceae bacterium]
RETDEINLSEYGPALGRRFRALKLWAVIRCHGRAGLQEVIRRHVSLASRFEEWVREDARFEVVAPRPFSVVCFRLRGGDDRNEALLERVNASGDAYISHTKLDGRYVIHLAVGNARTTDEDVEHAWRAIQREAELV